MEQVLIVYWSGTGNTAAMAEMVAEGIKEAGREAVILPAEEASVQMWKNTVQSPWAARPWEMRF